MPHLSVVIPIYCCQSTLEELYSRLTLALQQINNDYEIIFVNDYSPENDWQVISTLCQGDKKVKALSFSKNFGQQYAISAGLHHSSGDWVIVMDGDLEDAPEDIAKLYNKAQEGFEIVYADYSKKSKPYLIKVVSALYHKVFNFLANNSEEKGNARFVIIKRQVVEQFNKLGDKQRHFGPLLHTLGFKDFKLPIVAKQVVNHSSYTLVKKFNLAIMSIIAHSTVLLRLGIILGFFFSSASFLFVLFVVFKKLAGFHVKMGWSSVIASIYFVAGLILICAGILGMYIESIIHEVKDHPIYIVKEKLNF